MFASLVLAVVLSACPADCDADGIVSSQEIDVARQIIDGLPLDVCPAADVDGDGRVRAHEITRAINAHHFGCESCPGDLNADATVTIDEVVMAVAGALEGCP